MIRRALLASSTVLGLLVPLTLVAAPAAHAGGSCHADPTAARGDAVSMAGLCFEPSTLFTEPGARVTFTNDDGTPHNVTGHGFQWGTGDSMDRGDSIAATFADPGVYAYSCTIHPGMVGAVVVGDPTEALLRAPTAPAGSSVEAAPTTAAPTTAAEPAALAAAADVQTVAAVRDDDRGLGTGSAVAIAAGAALAGAAIALSWRARARGRARG